MVKENKIIGTRLYIKIAAIFFAVALIGCSESNKDDTTKVSLSYDLHVSFFDKELADIMASELEKEKIKYIRENDTKISYLVVNSRIVTNLIYEINMNDLPTGRSINISSNVSSNQFEKELTKAGIKYAVKHRKGLKWIVWSKEKKTDGQVILDEVLRVGKERLIKDMNS